jgi:hypothetical protein
MKFNKKIMMKEMKKIAVLVAVVLGMASCDLFNVDVDSTFKGVLDVQVDDTQAKSTAEGFHFDKFVELDPQDDPDVAQYADLIVNVAVNSVEAEVLSVSETGVVLMAGTVFSVWDESASVEWELPADLPIAAGDVISLEDLGGSYEDVGAILLDAEKFSVGMEGYSSKGGVTFTIQMIIDATITGNPF